MPWTRSGDNAATYPALMQLQGTRGADTRTLNEVFGFVWRCSCQSAAHLTDYVVDAGTAEMIGGARTAELVKLAVRAGVFTPRTVNGIRSWVLLQDPDFIHIQLAEEVMWGRQQRNDSRDPRLRVPVLRRDGDNCRWCGVLVQWRGKRTNRSGTLDHLNPGEPGTPETMIVACLGCNSGRGDNRAMWDDNHTLRAAPTDPRYGKTTAGYLTDHGYPTAPNVSSDAPAAMPAGADPAPQRVRPATPSTPGQALPPPRPQQPETWLPPRDGSPPEVARESSPEVDRTSPAGSGRDGLSTPLVSPDEPEASPPTSPAAAPGRPRRRGRRGGRTRTPDNGES